MQLAYSRLNLRWNPFGEASPGTRARLAVVSLPPWEAGRPLVVIGPPGRGKTTHLLALQAQHPDACYHRFHPERTQLPPGACGSGEWRAPRAALVISSFLIR